MTSTSGCLQSEHALMEMTHYDLFEDKDNNVYLIPTYWDDAGYLMCPQHDEWARVFLTHAQMLDALDGGRAAIHFDANYRAPSGSRAYYGTLKWDDLAPVDKETALWRERMVMLYVDLCERLDVERIPFTDKDLRTNIENFKMQIVFEQLDPASTRPTLKAVHRFRAPSAREFRRWYEAYKEFGGDPASLIPHFRKEALRAGELNNPEWMSSTVRSDSKGDGGGSTSGQYETDWSGATR